jgi:hypothetical protein
VPIESVDERAGARRASPLCRIATGFVGVVAALVLAAAARSQEPEGPQPTITWSGEPPAFFHGGYFSDDPWGEPLRSRPGPEAERWSFYVWIGMPLWLLIEVDGAPEGARLCVHWPDPSGEPAGETCQRLPSGPARLAFRGPENWSWPDGPYVARMLLDRDATDGERELLGEVGYALGELLAAARFDDLPAAAEPPRDGSPRIPTFPWPPPLPTTRTVLDRALVAADATTLGEVAERLTTALGGLGYSEHSFYSVPGGFALATRLEQIEFDGTPKSEPQRWSAALPPRELFSLADFIAALFTAPEGHYRVIVFVVNDRPFASSGEEATREEALRWLSGGLDRLPAEIGDAAFGDDHAGTALIYQFQKLGHEREPIANPDGAAPAAVQLARSRILDALAE